MNYGDSNFNIFFIFLVLNLFFSIELSVFYYFWLNILRWINFKNILEVYVNGFINEEGKIIVGICFLNK